MGTRIKKYLERSHKLDWWWGYLESQNFEILHFRTFRDPSQEMSKLACYQYSRRQAVLNVDWTDLNYPNQQ